MQKTKEMDIVRAIVIVKVLEDKRKTKTRVYSTHTILYIYYNYGASISKSSRIEWLVLHLFRSEYDPFVENPGGVLIRNLRKVVYFKLECFFVYVFSLLLWNVVLKRG